MEDQKERLRSVVRIHVILAVVASGLASSDSGSCGLELGNGWVKGEDLYELQEMGAGMDKGFSRCFVTELDMRLGD